MTYKSGQKHKCRLPVQCPNDLPLLDKQDDDMFLGTISADKLIEQQQTDPELRNLAKYSDSKTMFKCGLSSFFLHKGVLIKKNFFLVRDNYIFILTSALNPEVLHALPTL